MSNPVQWGRTRVHRVWKRKTKTLFFCFMKGSFMYNRESSIKVYAIFFYAVANAS